MSRKITTIVGALAIAYGLTVIAKSTPHGAHADAPRGSMDVQEITKDATGLRIEQFDAI